MDQETPSGPGEVPPPATPPPLLPPPSPAVPPPPVTRRRRNTGVWIVGTLLIVGLVTLGLIGLFVLQALAGLSGTAAPLVARSQLQEVVVKSEGSRHKIALIDIHGIIMGSALDASGYGLVSYLKDQLELAGEDHRVRAVLLSIDSPGGEVLASDQIYRALSEFQEQYDKPVVAAMQSVAASGGYYAAAPCRWIVAHELTLTGSVGVILQGYNYRGLMDKVGVLPMVYKSGRFKDMLSGARPESDITPEEKAMVQALVDEAFKRFKDSIRTGRNTAATANLNTGRPLAANWEDYADGRVLTGQQAYEHGFVDEVGDTEDAIERALQLAHIPDANLVRYQRPFGFGNLVRLLGQQESSTVKVDLGIDVPRLEAGHLYFLAPALF